MGFNIDKSSTSESTNRLVDYDVYLDVLNLLENKDKQIESLIESQKQTQQLLDQQQQLSLQDKQLINELRLQITLESPDDEPYNMDTVAEEEADEINVELKEEKPIKWWQFWK